MEKKKKQLIAVYGFIRNRENKFLLVKRADHDTHPGMWELPGGAVELNEDPEQAALREVAEEAHLDVTVVKPLATTTGISSKGHQVIRIAYLCEMDNPMQEVVLSSEHSEFRWIDLTEKPPLHLSELVAHIFDEKETLEL